MSAEPVTVQIIIEQLKAKPFVPFALTLVSNERLRIPTRGHVSLPPLDEDNRRPGFVVIYSAHTALPRYVALESIISLDHEPCYSLPLS